MTSFFKLSGAALLLAGLVYLLDTVLDAFAPSVNPGVGVWVPALGLIGLPGFWLSIHKARSARIALPAFVLGMAGLAGLMVVTFLNNRLFPGLPVEAPRAIIAAIRSDFVFIGVTFLLSAWLLLLLCWRTGRANRIGGLAYALGAVPVSLPPLMPAALVTAGGVLMGLALLLWGVNLLRAPTQTADGR